jgi:hypothetical protein
MHDFTQAVHAGKTALAVILFFDVGICAAQVPISRPPIQLQRPAQVAALPSSVSVMQASAMAKPLMTRVPMSAAEAGTLVEYLANVPCNPVNSFTTSNLLPLNFTADPAAPYPHSNWAMQQPNLHYVIERAVDQSNNWAVVTSTCSKTPSIYTERDAQNHIIILFVDLSGGLQPNTTYVYKVTAIAATGETSWNSFRWTSQPQLPTIQVVNYQQHGGTVNFSAQQTPAFPGQKVEAANRFIYKPPFGNPVVLPTDNWSTSTANTNTACGGDSMTLVCSVQVSAPAGQYSIALTMQWGLSLPPSHVFQAFAQSNVTYSLNLQP